MTVGIWPLTRVRRFASLALLGLASLCTSVCLLASSCASAIAEEAASWRFEPALAPPPPPGVPTAPYGVPLGQVGQISFWAPNRGLLITGGTEATGGPVPAGLYAYDGVSWHELATVCGGSEGRIAWAGPEEFWTISDQRAGQLVGQGQVAAANVSLCRFSAGQVVASYALPLYEPDSYRHMDAAACYGPSDCWFGGQDGPPPDGGAFHLHWDGTSVTVVYENDDHAIAGMVNYAGTLYESVQLTGADTYQPGESQSDPRVIRTIAPAGVEPTFAERFLFHGTPLPDYGEGVDPDALQGLDLATDGSPLGAGATQLWAAANPAEPTPAHSAPASLTVLHDLGENDWSQVLPPAASVSPLPAGTTLAGSLTEVSGGPNGSPRESGSSDAIAPEPDSAEPGSAGSAWLSLRGTGVSSNEAEVARLRADGTVTETSRLGPAQGVGDRGGAGPIVCPAQHDCWMATDEGWLFHLGAGAGYEQDTSPAFAGVISYRPPDGGVAAIPPDGFAEDDSLANQQQEPAPSRPPEQAPAPLQTRRLAPLVKGVKSRFVHHRVLVISFTLTARAHVQLIARKRGRVVAETRRQSLAAGPHRLSLSLDPARWPNKLQFEAKPIGAGAASAGGAGESSSGNTIST